MSSYEAKDAADRQHTLEGPTSSARNLYAVDDAASAKADDTNGTIASLPPAAAASQAGHHDAVNNIFSQLDNHQLSWFHIKTVIVAGMGFFCDSYDLFSISLVTPTLGRVYYPDTSYNCIPGAVTAKSNCAKILENLGVLHSDGTTWGTNYGADGTGWAATENNAIFGTGIPSGDQRMWNRILQHRPSALPTNTNYALTAVALCGTLAGQLLFGYLGDRFGRRSVFGITLYIMITACAAQMFSFGSSASGVIATLCFFRFCLGMGVGGDYPLSATLMSEYASKNNRGSMIAAVFAMQGIGYLVASAVAIILSAIWMRAEDTANPDHLWRIVLAFGAIPTALTLYARLNLPETPRYTMFVNQNATQLVEDMNFVLAAERARATGEQVALPSSLAGHSQAVAAMPAQAPVTLQARRQTYTQFFSKYWLTLLGTASCWFLLDISFYSQNLTQSTVFSSVGWLPTNYTMTIAREAYFTARAQAIVALSSTVPGYWMTVLTIEFLGRRNIQFMGFFFMTLFMAILAGDFYSLTGHGSFVAIYCLTFFFANWGPNSTTFILPAEVFPTQYRTLGHGISAACGKAGSIIGSFGFLYMKNDVSLQAALGLLTAVNGVGFFMTFLVPETKGRSLEEITEDQVVPGSAVTDKGLRKEVEVAQGQGYSTEMASKSYA